MTDETMPTEETPMTGTMPERIWIDPDLYNHKGQAICGDWSSDIMDGQCHEYVRADLARPAPAEGAVKRVIDDMFAEATSGTPGAWSAAPVRPERVYEWAGRLRSALAQQKEKN